MNGEETYAVALRYVPGEDASPMVLVNGQGEIARTIVTLARGLRLPLVAKPELAERLMRVPEDHPIPEELYEAVAVVLATLCFRAREPS